MFQSEMRHATFVHLDCEIHYWQGQGGDKHVLFFHGAGVDHRMFAP